MSLLKMRSRGSERLRLTLDSEDIQYYISCWCIENDAESKRLQ